MESSEAHTDGLVNEAAALLKAALEPRAPAEVGKLMDWSVSTINRSNLIQHMGVSRHGGTPKWMVYNGQSHILRSAERSVSLYCYQVSMTDLDSLN